MTGHDRPRERLVRLGQAALTDAELVAIHLGTGRQGEGVLHLAGKLLDEWGGVGGLARADVDELARTPGVGTAKACRLVAAFALADRGAMADRRGVRTSEDVAAVAIPRIGRARTEQVLLIVLDGSHRASRVVTVATGGATNSVVPVREVLSLALRHDAVAIALAHNHPGGSLDPSAEDLAVTERLRSGACEVGLRFLDHVIVAGDQWRSITASR
ncbi:MAG: DNA repair protein RadC [Actinobacteria bacterium]|nr:DNA repair protein RadC [Actinomycetota bacterium]